MGNNWLSVWTSYHQTLENVKLVAKGKIDDTEKLDKERIEGEGSINIMMIAIHALEEATSSVQRYKEEAELSE